MKYTMKPTEVEAVQFVDGRLGEAIDFCPRLIVTFGFDAGKDKPKSIKQRRVESSMIQPPDGADLEVKNGDWIVKHEDGTFTVVDDETFHDHFDAA